VVSGGKDAEVRAWAVPSGRCLGVGVGHVGAVSAVALARKGCPPKFLVSAGTDKLLKVCVCIWCGLCSPQSVCSMRVWFVRVLKICTVLLSERTS
jgi:WD40 repeat protein